MEGDEIKFQIPNFMVECSEGVPTSSSSRLQTFNTREHAKSDSMFSRT